MDRINNQRTGRQCGWLVEIAGTFLVTILVLVATVQLASAGHTNNPHISGNNAAGFGAGYTDNDYHDIDRKVCGFWGCNYNDGTNVFYNADGTGIVYRGMACGTHRYRHQSSDSSQQNEQLTRSCN